ncbi:MAG: hypothetical protein WCB12_22230 [Bryobacteraceae bacterium]
MQKDLLGNIIDVRRRHARQQNTVHHSEESPVQFAEGARVTGARGANHEPQVVLLICYGTLLLQAPAISRIT